MSQSYQSVLFETGYLARTYSSLANNPELAILELVANCWDAGASNVWITFPKDYDEALVIEDDGIGLTEAEFDERWMTLAYNRLTRQGKYVVFPDENNTEKRLAYGKNGIGRHGLICFNDEGYSIVTKKNGIKQTIKLTTKKKESPLHIESRTLESVDRDLHGTRLEVIVTTNFPDKKRISEKLSNHFLYNPSFNIYVDGERLSLETYSVSVKKTTIDIGNITLDISLINTENEKKKNGFLYEKGVALWQDQRLVGEPSWVLGGEQIIDQRITFAKHYLVIVKSAGLEDYVLPDWTGFKLSEEMVKVFNAIKNCVETWVDELGREAAAELKNDLVESYKDELSQLSAPRRRELDGFFSDIAPSSYRYSKNVRDEIVQAVIKLQEKKSGRELLSKLMSYSYGEIDKLNALLDEWDIDDAYEVLDLIDKRIKLIEALRRYCDDKLIDELHVLHPLITDARWLFGPEFESSEYVANKTLQKATKEVFGKTFKKVEFDNEKRRPDLILIDSGKISATAISEIDRETSLDIVKRILIIELKRGGFKLTNTEKNQASDYTDAFINLPMLRRPLVTTYVVGSEIDIGISSKYTSGDNNEGVIFMTTYSQLIDTAERRLFNLRTLLSDRYDEMSEEQIQKTLPTYPQITK